MDREFLIYNVAVFMEKYLPFVPSEEDLANCVAAMVDSQHMSRHKDGKLWFREFQHNLNEMDNNMNENDDAGETVTVIETVQTPQFSGGSNKVDACITSDNESQMSASDIAVPVEYNLKSAERRANNRKVVSANVQIMNADPRRMFTFGITIEADEVTLWYHCRSHSAICESFSIVENPELFIKAIMSFLFATKAELGYDPKVTLHKNELGDRYTYEIPQAEGADSLFYHTIKPIVNDHRNNITGHTTRVWLVRQVASAASESIPFGRECVLKDVWPDASAQPEKEVQAALFSDIEKAFETIEDTGQNIEVFNNIEDIKRKHVGIVKTGQYKKNFLTPLIEYKGEISKPVLPEDARITGLLDLPAEYELESSWERCTEDIPWDFPSKRQYCIVYEEVCKTVGELKTLGEVVDVLCKMLIPLQLMFCAGWVHRDINSGNVMAYRGSKSDSWQAKLGDLEYAKKYALVKDKASLDPKTGTPFFTAVEIMKQAPLFIVDDSHSTLLSSWDLSAPEAHQNYPPEFVIPNFQHDLESIWWILLWTITSRAGNDSAQGFIEAVFCNSCAIWEARLQCIENLKLMNLRSILAEPLKNLFPTAMEILQGNMFHHYKTRPTDFDKPPDLDSFSNVHSRPMTVLYMSNARYRIYRSDTGLCSLRV